MWTLQKEEKIRFLVAFCCIIKEKSVNLRSKFVYLDEQSLLIINFISL